MCASGSYGSRETTDDMPALVEKVPYPTVSNAPFRSGQMRIDALLLDTEVKIRYCYVLLLPWSRGFIIMTNAVIKLRFRLLGNCWNHRMTSARTVGSTNGCFIEKKPKGFCVEELHSNFKAL